MCAFLTNWAQTIDDALNNAIDHTWVKGGLPETIPDITGGYNADASWSSVWPTTLHTLWKSCGDARIVQRYWPDLMLYVNQTVAGMKGGDIKGIFSTWGDCACAFRGGGVGGRGVVEGWVFRCVTRTRLPRTFHAPPSSWRRVPARRRAR
jgi:hypothetical protein